MSRKHFLYIGLAVFLAAIVVQAPACALLWLVPDSLQVTSVSGTVWQGKANQVQGDFDGKPLVADRIEWQLKPWSLLFFAPAVDVQLSAPGQTASGTVQWHGQQHLQLQGFEVELHASALAVDLPGQLTGKVELQLADFEIDQQSIKLLDGRLVWQRAGWRDSEHAYALGDIAADLSEQDGKALAQLFDLSGPLEINANLQLSLPDQLSVDGLLKARQGAPVVLVESLPLFADATDDGRYHIEFDTAL